MHWMTGIRANESGNRVTQENVLDSSFMEEYVLYMMARASQQMSAEFHAIIRSRGLRVPEWRILATLASYEPQSVTQLGEKTLYDQPRLTKTIDKMKLAGLVRRKRHDRDRRMVQVTMTEQGREVAAGLIALAREHELRALDALTPMERKHLKRIMRKLM